MQPAFEVTGVIVRTDNGEESATRAELWRCPCGHLFGRSSVGETCLGCGAEIVEVRDRRA